MRSTFVQKGNRNWLLVAAFLSVPVLAWAGGGNVVHTKQDVPFSGTVQNPCNGENVTFSGTEHDDSHVVMDKAGGAHVQLHINLQDVSGVGDQGNNYQIPLTENIEQNVTVGQETTAEAHLGIISQGSAPNFEERILIHMTVNPDGTVTSSKDVISTTCTG